MPAFRSRETQNAKQDELKEISTCTHPHKTVQQEIKETLQKVQNKQEDKINHLRQQGLVKCPTLINDRSRSNHVQWGNLKFYTGKDKD